MQRKRSEQSKPPRGDAVLIIGVHREELAFGDKVAAGLDSSLIDVVRIPEGLSGHRPRQDEIFYYEILHRELYHQLLGRVRGRYSIVLDLHCGLDESGLCADLISSDRPLLACVQRQTIARFGETEGNKILRLVLLDGKPNVESPVNPTPAHTVIPPEVWNATTFVYVGIEIYLPTRDSGNATDWELARWLIRTIVECRRVVGEL